MRSQITILSPFENHLLRRWAHFISHFVYPCNLLHISLGVLLVASKNSHNSYLSKEDT